MRGGLSYLASLVATGLRGLRSRLLLTVGSVLLTAIAVAAAVVGPMYQSAGAASFLVTNLRSQPDFLTGVTIDYTPDAALSSEQADRRALGAVNPSSIAQFRRPELSLWTYHRPIRNWQFPAGTPQATLLAESGICRHLVVTGRCPSSVGEVLMLRSDAAFTESRVGDEVEVEGLSRPLTVVGTYRLVTNDNASFNPSRFISVLPHASLQWSQPYQPAPFVVTPATVTALAPGQWFVRVDYRLRVPASTTPEDLRAAAHEVSVLPAALHSRDKGGSLSLESGNALGAVAGQAHARQVTAQQTVTPAVVSLILVALVLLARLLAAAMEARRPELALAALRGIGRRQLWVLAMLEPVLMLAIAAPIGVVGGFLAAQGLAAAWLVPGLPVVFGKSSAWFAAGVVVASLLVAALAVRSTLAEQLSVQISGTLRPTRAGRWVVLLRLALIAAAIAVLGGTLWSGGRRSKPNAADLALPILLAVAGGLLMTLGAAIAANWWAKRSARRRGVAGYVASRTIARRREGTWMILPLTAALAIAVFAAGIYSAAADWRASEAATTVGADMSFHTKIPLTQAIAVTHRIDPDKQWLMAVGAYSDIRGPKVIIDTPRLARVAAWPNSWTPDLSVSRVADELSPVSPPLILTGRRVQMSVDNQVSGKYRGILVSIDVQTPNGGIGHIYIGPYPPGRTTLSTPMRGCRVGCQVTGLTFSGPGTVAESMHGTVTISDVKADGHSVPYFSRIGWRDTSDSTFVYGAPVVTRSRVTGSALRIELDSHGERVIAMLTPRDVPAAMPVLMGRTAQPYVVSRQGDELTVSTGVDTRARIRPIATSESMPVFGPAGMLMDYTVFTRTNLIDDTVTSVSILARSDTPQSVLNQLAAHGITQRTTMQQVRHTLDRDPYALALNLYLVVTVIVMLLAFAGLAVNMAIQIPARRRDAASLRVVGLPRRSIVAAVAAEFTVVLGTAAVAGILAGALSQYVVVRTVTLGYADSLLTPRVLPSLDLATLGALVGLAITALFFVSILFGGLTIRGSRTESLRETAG
jgi:putative ABC transport system permease protein